PAGGQRRVIDPHRKLQIGGAMLVDGPGGFDDLPAVPGQCAAECNGRSAIEYLQPSCHAGREDVAHDIGPDMAVGAHQLTGHDHDRPDQEVDHDLFRIADRLVRKEVARQHLPKSDGERRQAEHTDDRLLGAIPRLPHHGGLPSPQSTAASSAETAETISEEIFDSFATRSWSAIISSRFAPISSADGTTILMPRACTSSRARD